MEIRVLRYFLAVAREGSLTGASAFLHITQPTLSRQIKDLEDEIGQKLFIRGSHNMTLTKEGFIFRKRAEEIIAMVDKTQEEFQAMETDISGDIYIGGGETQAIRLLASVIKDLNNDYPDIRYHLYSGNFDDVTERLDRGLIDFGVIVQPADLSKYDCLHLPSSDRWGVVMRKDSPLAKKKYIKKEDLLDLPLICSRQAISDKKQGNEFLAWFGDDFEKYNIVSTFNLVYNAALLVEAGIGYAITIDEIANISDDSELTFRPLKPALNSGLDVIWKKYQVFSQAAELFLERMTQAFDNTASDQAEDSCPASRGW